MGWQVGIEILGFGLAIFTFVAPMLGLAMPREALVLLFSISILLILAWPVGTQS